MKFKVGDKVRIKDGLKLEEYGVTPSMLGYCGEVMTIKSTYPTLSAYYLVEDNCKFIWCENTLEPVDSKTLRMADGTIIGEFNTGGTLPTREWSKLIFKNGSSIEVLPQKDNTVRSENHFCNGFRGGKIPTPEKPVSIDVQPLELVCNEEQAKEIVERLNKELAGHFNAFSNDGISTKNGGKNTMKFTFYVTEGTRVDKSCNGTIPTMTTTVTNGLDEASVTCDKVDFNERQGVLEGIAQLYCKGRFDKEYEAAVKLNKRNDKANRTCVYCRKIFDTAEERVEHEKWHVECRKARHQRYLLRKRAKEIAFEEAAQKMAKEMMGEQK